LRKNPRKPIWPTLDTRTQLEAILAVVRSDLPSPEVLRAVRAIAVLEEVGSPEARQVLEKLAQGSPYALPTQHARAALQRITWNPEGR